MRDGTVFDPAALDEAIGRYETIKRLKEKHGRSIPELLEYADELRERLSSIDNADEEIAALEAQHREQAMALRNCVGQTERTAPGTCRRAGTADY